RPCSLPQRSRLLAEDDCLLSQAGPLSGAGEERDGMPPRPDRPSLLGGRRALLEVRCRESQGPGSEAPMSASSYDFTQASWWTRFGPEPVRAERLALVRIFFALALLADQFLQYVPRFVELFGAEGAGYAGLNDEDQLRRWRWTILLSGTDNLSLLWPAFWV